MHSNFKCVGLNQNGQISTPENLKNIVENFAAGYKHTCVFLIDASLFCFGRNKSNESNPSF